LLNASIQTLELAGFPLLFLRVAFDCGGGFALSAPSGLFVELPPPDFGENAGFFTGAFEAAEGDVERFVLFNAY